MTLLMLLLSSLTTTTMNDLKNLLVDYPLLNSDFRTLKEPILWLSDRKKLDCCLEQLENQSNNKICYLLSTSHTSVVTFLASTL